MSQYNDQSTSKSRKNITPPLVDLKVTNPITYIKSWWRKIIGNEGVDFRFRIHPLTAIAIAVIIASIGFGVGRFVIPFSVPFFKFEDISKQSPSPSPTSEIWKETGFIGTLQYSYTTSRYYLLTTSSEAITLEVPQAINLKDLIGKRIFAIGNYNKTTRILVVTDTKDMEILSKTPIPLPTITPSPTPTPIPEATPSPSPGI